MWAALFDSEAASGLESSPNGMRIFQVHVEQERTNYAGLFKSSHGSNIHAAIEVRGEAPLLSSPPPGPIMKLSLFSEVIYIS